MCRKCAAILFVKSTRLIIASILLTGVLAEAAVVVHNSGVTTYSQNFGNGSDITVTGGEATFTGKVNRSSTISVTGGIANFTGTIERNPTFNLSGGSTVLGTVKNNAIFNLSGTAYVSLTGNISNNASFDIRDNAQLEISADRIFENISEVTATGGSIITNGYDFTVDETVLSGLTLIDLGGGTNQVNLGTLSGSGQLVFTNYDPTTEVFFSAFGGFDPGTQLIFDGVGSLVFDGYVTPVPEPAVTTLVMLLASGGFVYVRRRRKKKK